jgi:hypothetical protein
MKKFVRAGLLAAAASAAAMAITSAKAFEVNQVQLGVVDLGGSACPRDAKVTAWAHTDGPGIVKFVVRNNSGGKSGEHVAVAVQGPAGNYLATWSNTFKIQTDVDIKYMVEAVGHAKRSNWVNFTAKCGPSPKKTTTTTSGKKPTGKHISELDKPTPKKTTTTTSGKKPKGKHVSELDKDDEPQGKPAQNGKPASKPLPAGKPIAQCKPALSVTRVGAFTKAGGLAAAQAGWQASAAGAYGVSYGRWAAAANRSATCKAVNVVFNCTVKAEPCQAS